MIQTNEAPAPQVPPAGAPQWHARLPDGQQFGPLTDDQMRDWVAQGSLPADALVWCDGWPEWQPLSAVMHQFPPAQPVAAPPPPAMFGAIGEAEDEGIPEMSSAPTRSVGRRRSGSDAQVWVIILVVGLFLLIPVLLWALANQPGG